MLKLLAKKEYLKQTDSHSVHSFRSDQHISPFYGTYTFLGNQFKLQLSTEAELFLIYQKSL